MESSIANNYFLSTAFLLTISIFFYSKAGFSNATIYANIYSSRQLAVIAKLIIVTFTNVSGE